MEGGWCVRGDEEEGESKNGGFTKMGWLGEEEHKKFRKDSWELEALDFDQWASDLLWSRLRRRGIEGAQD